jgi:hypothetical protein
MGGFVLGLLLAGKKILLSGKSYYCFYITNACFREEYSID